MLDQGIHMLPATFDPFLKEGPAISWLWHGNKQQVFHQETYNFGNAVDTQSGLEMCCLSTSDPLLTALLLKANKLWKERKTDTVPFGSTYIDTPPSTWRQQFLATHYTWAFTRHLLSCYHCNNQFLLGLDADTQRQIEDLTSISSTTDMYTEDFLSRIGSSS
eukprot:9138098-Ditylum_brightwellii.AAC.1